MSPNLLRLKNRERLQVIPRAGGSAVNANLPLVGFGLWFSVRQLKARVEFAESLKKFSTPLCHFLRDRTPARS
jgi:hypothetical protein